MRCRGKNNSPDNLINENNAGADCSIGLLDQFIGREKPGQRLSLTIRQAKHPWQMPSHRRTKLFKLSFLPERDLCG